MTSLDVTNMTFEDKKTCFLLSAINECGFLKLTVVYSRFHMETEETESQLFLRDIILIPPTVLPVILIIAVAAVIILNWAIYFNTRKDFFPQQPSKKITCIYEHL
jgi:hypothetical protein